MTLEVVLLKHKSLAMNFSLAILSIETKNLKIIIIRALKIYNNNEQ